MRIHLLAEAAPNPVLTAVMAELAREHDVEVYDARTLPAGYGRGSGLQEPPDVVLLKSRTPQARQVAQTAERAGSVVVNPPAATTAALDRAATAEALDRAGVPAPRTWSFATLRDLAADGVDVPWPLVVKSRTSSRRDLVRLLPSRAELVELVPEWGDEPVVALLARCGPEDVLVVGTRGGGTLAGLIHASVARGVLDGLPCEVIVVPPGARVGRRSPAR